MNILLNETLASHAKDLVYREELDFSPIPNPLAQLAQITGREEWEGTDLDWMNLWASTLRRMTIESLRQQDVIISASWGIDQVAHQAAFLSDQVIRQQIGGLVGPDGKPIVAPEQTMATNRTGGVLQVLVNSAEFEAVEVFDFTYSVIPVALTPDTNETQAAVLAQYDDFLATVPAFQNVVRLPDNEEAALDALRIESEKWKQVLSSSS